MEAKEMRKPVPAAEIPAKAFCTEFLLTKAKKHNIIEGYKIVF